MLHTTWDRSSRATAIAAAAAAAAATMARYRGAGGRNVTSLNLLPGLFQHWQGKWCKRGADSPYHCGGCEKVCDGCILWAVPQWRISISSVKVAHLLPGEFVKSILRMEFVSWRHCSAQGITVVQSVTLKSVQNRCLKRETLLLLVAVGLIQNILLMYIALK